MRFAIFDTKTRTYGSEVFMVQQAAADKAAELNKGEPCFRYAVAPAPMPVVPRQNDARPSTPAPKV